MNSTIIGVFLFFGIAILTESFFYIQDFSNAQKQRNIYIERRKLYIEAQQNLLIQQQNSELTEQEYIPIDMKILGVNFELKSILVEILRMEESELDKLQELRLLNRKASTIIYTLVSIVFILFTISIKN